MTVYRWLAAALLFAATTTMADVATSQWVHPGPDGKLVYKTTPAGDRIMDFSYAGYMGGGVALPDVPVKRTLKPTGAEDDSDAIQSAIDDVSASPLSNGFRGAVLLASGTFHCSRPIDIRADGVVLRGSGSAGESRTTIEMTGSPHLAVSIGGRRGRDRATTQPDENADKSVETRIADAYVPSGATQFKVANISGLAVGDTIGINRPVTEAWVKFMQMDDLTRDGRPQSWIRTGTTIVAQRTIAGISGNTIMLDVPLSDSFDAKYLNPPGTSVVKINPPQLVSQSAVENLHIECPPQEISHTQPHFTALHINGQDCWARNLVIDETMNSVGVTGRRITLQRVAVNRKVRHQGASKPAEFAPNGTQVLMDRCSVTADNVWFAATGAGVSGPVVLLNCTFHGNGSAESHQRWSTGMLYDNCRAPDGGIEMRNRGAMGSGHGWSMGWGVIWNCTAGHFIVQNPPGAMNWLIGSKGEARLSPRPFGSGPDLPQGEIESSGAPVAPQSLYLTQLQERLGTQALTNLGYASTSIESTETSAASSPHQLPARIDHVLGRNLAIDRPVLTSNVRQNKREFAGWQALDENDATYWATDDGITQATLELDTEGALQINAVELSEASEFLGRVHEYKVEGEVDSDWKLLSHGTSIGDHKIDRFPKVTVWKVRLTILNADAAPAIRKFGLYLENPAAGDGGSPADSKSASSEWVHLGETGKLVYKTTPAGDRILDFSHAGYMGGGVALPDVPVKVTVAATPLHEGKEATQASPLQGPDDTARIQAAIDQVGKMPADENGFRGAVMLAPGTFTCSKTITITSSGVVLRGSGSDSNGTTIKMVGERHRAILIGRDRNARADRSFNDDEPAPTSNPAEQEFTEALTAFADAYVPCGATRFNVADAKSFSVGDEIVLRRPTTPAWLHFMEMDTLSRDGRHQTWIGVNRSGFTERKITAIAGNQITVDIPLSDSYDSKYLNPPGVSVARLRPPARITQVGIEHLHFQCPPLEIDYGHAPYSAIRVGGDDCWVKDVNCEELMNDTVLAGKRITIQQVVCTHTFPNLGASKPTDFSIEGTQILIDRCKVTGDNEYFVWTGSLEPGPNVILNSTFRGRGSRIQPHQRWSTGLLVDICTVPDGGIDFCNRGVAGSGHGWTMGWAVAWNCVAKTYVIQNPPGVFNWAIGCIGSRPQQARYFDTEPILPEGIFESHGTPVAPQSLYLAQLSERLGPKAIKNVGYDSNTPEMFRDKSTPPLPERKARIDPELGPDLAFHRPVNTNNDRGKTREFGGEKAVDGDDKTCWSINDNVNHASLEIDTEGPLEINAIELGEASGMEGRVLSYKVEGQVDSDWKLLSEGTTIGEKKIDRFPKVTVWKVRLTIVKTAPDPGICEFGLYLKS